MPLPLVSVVIAACQGEKYIGDAIQSILDQTYLNYEIWVIENGVADQTRQIALGFPNVQYCYLTKGNVALARNVGGFLGYGKYLAFLDQDDTWVPEKLTQQVLFLEENPNYGAVIGLQQMYLEPGVTKPSWLKKEFLEAPQFGYLPSALMVRRDLFMQTHSFNPTWTISSDVDWFFEAQDREIAVGVLNQVLIRRRIHAENNSNQYVSLQRELLYIMKASISRKREKGCLPKLV